MVHKNRRQINLLRRLDYRYGNQNKTDKVDGSAKAYVNSETTGLPKGYETYQENKLLESMSPF